MKSDYEKGLEAAWECARDIAVLPRKDKESLFNDHDMTAILLCYDVSEAMKRLKDMKEETNGE